MNLQTLVRSTRPPFLVLTPVCVFLGIGAAVANQAEVSTYLVTLVTLGALFAHISVNTLNCKTCSRE